MATLSNTERSYIIAGLLHPETPTRLDNRGLLTPRPISISYGDAPQASGSARVILSGTDGGVTEVLAGIRLEVLDVPISSKGKGKEPWRGTVEVDITPQAYPQLRDNDLQRLSTLHSALLSDHFIPSVPALPIIPGKYFQPHLHLTLLSSSSGSVPSTLVLAARAAFMDLRIPRTKRVGWEGADQGREGEGDLSGIKAAVRTKKKLGRSGVVKGDDWDLDLEHGDGMDPLSGREDLPVLITLNLVPDSAGVFIDATTREEAACPNRVHAFYTGSGKLCGLRMEGSEGIDVTRIKGLLLEGKRIAGELVASLNAEISA